MKSDGDNWDLEENLSSLKRTTSDVVTGARNVGSFVVTELLRLKAIGTVSSATIVS